MGLVIELPKPKHGEQRNWRMEKAASNHSEFVAGDGSTIEIESHSSEHSASERFCATCDKWVTAVGVLGGVWCPACLTNWHKN
jgi:hypothetical protein